MSNNVDIANQALAHIGEAMTVTSLAPALGSPHAALCAELLPKAREYVLSRHTWRFADARIALAHPRIAVSSVSTGGDSITTSTAHSLADNNVVRVVALTDATVLPVPLEEDTDYYVLSTGTTTLQLAEEADGDAINLTAGLTGSMVIERRSDRSDWTYAYAVPADMCRPLRVVPNLTSNEDLPGAPPFAPYGSRYLADAPSSWTQRLNYGGDTDPLVPFKWARNSAGEQVIYTNQEDADLCYTAFDDESEGWPPQFESVVTWRLASLLAGAVRREPAFVRFCQQQMEEELARAAGMDANSSHVPIQTGWPFAR